jgi:hypothetical protein
MVQLVVNERQVVVQEECPVEHDAECRRRVEGAQRDDRSIPDSEHRETDRHEFVAVYNKVIDKVRGH